MIIEDYVSFETAKLLKEKGFDMSCEYLGYNIFDADHRQDTIENFSRSEAPHLYVPTISQARAMKWLREEHDLHIDIFVSYKDGVPHYQWSVDNLKTQDTISETPCCNTYEKACEAAIKYCLENLIYICSFSH